MSILASILGAEDVDPARSVHWLWPEQAELIYGSISSLLIFGLLWKFAGPAIKKAMSDRTERIQNELDESATAKTEAEAEAADIRQAAGDIDGERQRLFAEADAALAEGDLGAFQTKTEAARKLIDEAAGILGATPAGNPDDPGPSPDNPPTTEPTTTTTEPDSPLRIFPPSRPACLKVSQ